MAGLLGDALPWMYSQGDRAKRYVNGLLDDPLGVFAREVNHANDRAGVLLDMTQAAADEGLRWGPANQKLAALLADSYSPVGMVAPKEPLRHLPSSSSLNVPPAPNLEVIRQFGRVESVPLSQARGTQRQMDWEKFRAGESPGPLIPGYVDKPVAVRREDGEYLIFDGHHRTVDAFNKGIGAIDMYVVDAKKYAPEAAGRKPGKGGISAEDLMRELTGR